MSRVSFPGNPTLGPKCILAKAAKAASRMVATGACMVKRWLRKDESEADDACNCSINSIDDFRAVTASLDYEAIPEYVSSIRRSQVSRQRNETTPWSFECTVESPPLHGSYNILFPVMFGDGSKWLLKVPCDGHEKSWNESAAQSLRSEALTMRYLKGKGLPVPDVFAFDVSMNNSLKCPFILMEFLEGRPLYEGWFDDPMTEQAREAFRQRSLQTLASLMIQVNATTDVTQAGSPQYDEEGNIGGIGPFRIPNPLTHRDHLRANNFVSEAYENYHSYREIEPTGDGQAYLLSMLDQHLVQERQSSLGANKLLRMFIDWSSTGFIKNDFVLTHPDLDLQNILVDETGKVVGLVDWDGVTTVPRAIGCAYPKWISRDWDPECYRWACGRSSSDSFQMDHSPKDMSRYREMYARSVEEALSKSGNTDQHVATYSDMVRRSVLFDNLRRAATRPKSSYYIVFKVCDLIGQLTGQKSLRPASHYLPGSSVERDSLNDSDSNKQSDSESASESNKSSSSSEGSSEDSKSTRATSLASDHASVNDLPLITPHNSWPSSPKQASKLSVVIEESEEDITATPGTAERVQEVNQQCDVSHPRCSFEEMRGSHTPPKLRTILKRLHSGLSRRNNIVYRMSGTDNLTLVVDSTIFDTIKRHKGSMPAELDEGASDPQAYEQHGPLSSIAMAQSPIPQDGSCVLGNNLPENGVSEPILKADQSKIAGSGPDVVDQSMRADTHSQPEKPHSSPDTSPNESSTSSEDGKSHIPEEPQIQWRRKGDFCRRVVAKLAFPCGTPDLDGSSLPCREIKSDYVPPTKPSRKKRVCRWIKAVVRKNRTEDELVAPSTSLTSGPPLSATAPRISQTFDFGPLKVNPFDEMALAAEGDIALTTEDELPSPAHNRKDDTHQTPHQRMIHAGIGDCYLQHLEPVSDEILRSEEFMTHQIFEALAEGTLDEARMERLKSGFFTLLDSL